jgi:hypothetical protein
MPLTLLVSFAGRDSDLDLVSDHRVRSYNPITLEDDMKTFDDVFA